MDIVRTVVGLEPLAEQVKTARKSVQGSVRPKGWFNSGWQKATDELTSNNNSALYALPNEIRVSPDVAKQCVIDETDFINSVQKLYNPGGIPKGLGRVADIYLAGQSGDPILLAYKVARAFIDTYRDDRALFARHKDLIENRNPTLGPILCTYALCEDRQGFFLKKATWRTNAEWETTTMGDGDYIYSSVPSQTGIDASVDVEKLVSKQRER